MFRGFWDKLDLPIIGLSPMDGVTDVAMREISAIYGKPAVMLTEFVAAEGIAAGATKLLEDFEYSEIQRPIVAQIFGKEPEAFRITAYVVAALGFDGVDINMGCPAKNVEQHGSGAALIQTPEIAAQIIAKTKLGVEQFAGGMSPEEAGLPRKIIKKLREDKRFEIYFESAKLIPVSVKTRVGYDKPVTKEWISHLVAQDLANISLHGRTLKQYYGGLADWDEIKIAAEIVHESGKGTTILGNGDIANLKQAHERIQMSKVDGVLIGRAAMGDPWVFVGKEVDYLTRLKVLVEHARIYEKFEGGGFFLPMRKHLAWYCKGFPGAAEARQKLVLCNSSTEVEEIISKL